MNEPETTSLVISRKKGEIVWIGETSITVLTLSNNRVRLRICAPPDVPISREELLVKLAQDPEVKEGAA